MDGEVAELAPGRGPRGAVPPVAARSPTQLALLPVAPAEAPRQRRGRQPGAGCPGRRAAAHGPRVLQRPRRLRRGRPRVRHDPRQGRDDAGTLDQRHRQCRVRLPGLGRGQRLHLGREQPREPADALVERSGRRSAGEAFYIRDEASGALWTPTAQPIRDGGRYVARHGFGYSRFEHSAHGIALEPAAIRAARRPDQDLAADAAQPFRPAAPPVGHQLCRMGARNLARRLGALHRDRDRQRHRRASRPQPVGNRLSRPRRLRRPLRRPDGLDRPTAREFIGRGGELGAPAALGARRRRCRARPGPALDPCAALSRTLLDLPPGESVEVVGFLGQCASVEAARDLVARYRACRPRCRLRRDVRPLATRCSAPSRSTRRTGPWTSCSTAGCSTRRSPAASGRAAAFYQASGAYGFRDQLQDGMALTFAAAGGDARASPARRRAAVRRGRRAALVAAAFGPGRAHPHLRRPGLARLCRRHLRHGDRRRRRCWTRACRSSTARRSRPASTTPSSSPTRPTRRRRCSSIARAASTSASP